jgi:hypothetical protein
VSLSDLLKEGLVFRVYSLASKKPIAIFSVPLMDLQLRHSLKPSEKAHEFTEPDSQIKISFKVHLNSIALMRNQLLAVEDDERLMAMQDLYEMASRSQSQLHAYLMDEGLLLALLDITTHWLHDAMFSIELAAILPKLWKKIVSGPLNQCVQYFTRKDGVDCDFFEYFVDSMLAFIQQQQSATSSGRNSPAPRSGSVSPDPRASPTSNVPKSSSSTPPGSLELEPQSHHGSVRTGVTSPQKHRAQYSTFGGGAFTFQLASSGGITPMTSGPSSSIFFNRERKLQMIHIFNQFLLKSIPTPFRNSLIAQLSKMLVVVARYITSPDAKSSTPRAAQEEFLCEILHPSTWTSSNLTRAPHHLIVPAVADILCNSEKIGLHLLIRTLHVLKELPPPTAPSRASLSLSHAASSSLTYPRSLNVGDQTTVVSVPNATALYAEHNLVALLDSLSEHPNQTVQKLANHNWSKCLMVMTGSKFTDASTSTNLLSLDLSESCVTSES